MVAGEEDEGTPGADFDSGGNHSASLMDYEVRREPMNNQRFGFDSGRSCSR